jgi:ferredoxin-NADP reductase
LVTYSARGEFSTRNPATGAVAKKSCKNIAMIAGGTGITPMLQVIRQIFNDVGDTTRVNLLFANVSSADILLKKELDELASAHKNLTVHYAIDKDEQIVFIRRRHRGARVRPAGDGRESRCARVGRIECLCRFSNFLLRRSEQLHSLLTIHQPACCV